MKNLPTSSLERELDEFDLEVPSWGFGRGGTRFETYTSKEDPQNLEERIQAAGRAHKVTGMGRKVSLHFPWDGETERDVDELRSLLDEEELEAGAVNANLFSMRGDSPLDARLRYGSLISPFEEIREGTIDHIFQCIEWMRKLESDTLILWIPDGSYSYGQISFFDMFERVRENVGRVSKEINGGEKLLVEYKPFEPAFYATTVFDWGSAVNISKYAGENTKVLVDTGHHLQGGNVEQIVAYLARMGELGGFHFNDRKYADDDLVTGSLRPGQLFRIFCTLEEAFERSFVEQNDVSFMIDQSHYVRDPTEAVVESIENILLGFLKSKLVDLAELEGSRKEADVPQSDRIVDSAFQTDVRPALNGWRRKNGLPENPLDALRGK